MKATRIIKHPISLSLAALMFVSQIARGAEPTALSLIKEGNRYVGEDVKDRIVEIYSDKSVGNTTPNVWHIVYYDPNATLKSTEVTFGGGKKMDVKRPMRLVQPITGDQKEMDRKKMKVDSDKALKTASQDPLLEKLTLRASQMWLQHGDVGPVWKVRLWAAKLKDPGNDVDIGDVYIAADDGKVMRRDLHIDRVD